MWGRASCSVAFITSEMGFVQLLWPFESVHNGSKLPYLSYYPSLFRSLPSIIPLGTRGHLGEILQNPNRPFFVLEIVAFPRTGEKRVGVVSPFPTN